MKAIRLKNLNSLHPYKLVGMVKVMTTKDEFYKLCAEHIKGIIDSTRNIIDYDTILIVGEQNGEIINEIQFIKYEISTIDK